MATKSAQETTFLTQEYPCEANNPRGPEKERFCEVPIIAPEASWILPCVAVVLQFVVALLLAIVALVGVWAQHDPEAASFRPISTAVRVVYVTTITILASLISTFTSGQMRTLWLREVLHSRSAATGCVTLHQRYYLTNLVGQASIVQKAKTWRISLTFLISGLITTAIVAGLSFQDGTYQQTYTTLLSTHFSQNDLTSPCLLMDGNSSSSMFAWVLANGSTLAVNQNASEIWECEPRTAKTVLLDPMRNSLASSYAYIIGGVPVDYNAIGVGVGWQYDLTTTFGVNLWLSQQNRLQWSQNCVPVLSTNPVQCQAIGSLTVSPNLITVEADGCNVSTPIYAVDPITQGATAAGACTENHELGTATIVIGSVNSHATKLARSLNGDAWNINQTVDSYVVACTVDIAPSISFQQVRYETINSSDYALLDGTASPYRIVGYSDQVCEPYASEYTINNLSIISSPSRIGASRLLTDTALATAAGASWPLLIEGRYSDGSLETLFDAFDWENGWLVFNNSRNSIEDTLGLVSGIALGFFWGFTFNADLSIDNGVSEFIGVRIGPGKAWAIVYIFPSLFAATVLCFMIWRTRHAFSSS